MNCGESLPNSVLGLFYGQRALALQEWKSPRGYASLEDDPSACWGL